MAHIRVLVLGEKTLYSEGVIRLLQEQPDLEVVAVDPRDPDAAVQLPDPGAHVIVVFSRDRAGAPPEMAKLLRGSRDARIIYAGLEQPELEVYRSEGVAAASAPELLAAIRRRRRRRHPSPATPARPERGGSIERLETEERIEARSKEGRVQWIG